MDNPKYTNFGSCNDELAEKLLVDSAMMKFMQCAIDTHNPAQVLQAAKTIVMARDHREISIRKMFDDFPD